MVCVYCGDKTQVTNSRPKTRTKAVWRRRQCDNCQGLFTTIETVDFSGSVLVSYGDGSIVPFRRDVLFLSIHDSLKHRKDASRAATALTDTVLSRILPLITQAKLNRQDIVTNTLNVLQRFDKAAGVYYRAYHSL